MELQLDATRAHYAAVLHRDSPTTFSKLNVYDAMIWGYQFQPPWAPASNTAKLPRGSEAEVRSVYNHPEERYII